jgi:trk system potassium uptake protein TrkH
MARWESGLIRLLGAIDMAMGAVLLVPAMIAVYYGEDPMPFVCPVPVLLFLGALQYLLFRSSGRISSVSKVMMTMFVVWWIAFLVGAIPFRLCGFSFIDSLFEGVSGLTTTGVSALGDAVLPNSLIFWRSFTQWAGGIAVVLIFLFLIPAMGIGGKTFVNNEFAGSGTYNFSMGIKNAAKNFLSIYVLLSAIEAVLLIISGVESFEAATMTLSTISTGGFMAGGNSIVSYPFAVQFIVLAFMFLGGTNFYLHYRAVRKREFSAYRESQEFVWTVIWFLAASAAIASVILIGTGNTAADIGGTVWNTVFTVVSMGTTTGYVIADQTFWPLAAYVIMWIVMLFGSMSGSTSGGIKIYRIVILKSYLTNGVYKMFHPRSVRDVRLDGHSVSDDSVVSAIVVIIAFIAFLTVSVAVMLVLEPEIGVSEAMGLSISTISNTGINTGSIALDELGSVSKIFLSFMMWFGRLEVVMTLLLFTRTFWTELILDIKGDWRAAGSRKI